MQHWVRKQRSKKGKGHTQRMNVCELVFGSMTNRRLIILLNVDIRSSNSFLFGKHCLVQNGNINVYIDSVLPIPRKNSMGSTKFSRRMCNGSKLLGIVLEDTQVCDYDCVNIFKKIFASFLYYAIVLPTKGASRKSVLVIPASVGGNDKIFCQEVMVIGLRRNVEHSTAKLPLPRGNNLDTRLTEEVKSSQLPLEIHWVNGLMRRKSVGKIKRNPMLGMIFQLLSSVLWFIRWNTVHDSVPGPQLFLVYCGKFFFVAKQLLYRLNQIDDMVINEKKISGEANLNTRSISVGNKILSVLIDVILGLMIVKFVFSNWDFLSISSWIIGQKYTVAEQLQNLLKWLMGVPAGLKLNKPLNQFLGNFYIYHVHLWTSYLYFIEEYLSTIIFICTLSGCLGITFLFSVLCDVLSLLTLHIYCFYIYAARLYNFEIYALSSLLRLFTGKLLNGNTH